MVMFFLGMEGQGASLQPEKEKVLQQRSSIRQDTRQHHRPNLIPFCYYQQYDRVATKLQNLTL